MSGPIMPPRRATTTTTPLREVVEPSYGETKTQPTRAEVRRNAADITNTNFGETFDELYKVLGSTNIVNHDVSPFDIDTLASELVAVRNAKDLVEGRESALKQYAIDLINSRIASTGKDPASESGYLVSPENGVKLSKEVSGGKLNVDIDLLETILDEDQFKSVTNHVTVQKVTITPDNKVINELDEYNELNEEALEKQLKLGNIGMEQIIKATVPGKVRSAFYVRSL